MSSNAWCPLRPAPSKLQGRFFLSLRVDYREHLPHLFISPRSNQTFKSWWATI